MRETTIHSECGCSGKLQTTLRNSWWKPAVRVECSAQNKGCNIGRNKVINLTKCISFSRKSKNYQLSTAAVKLAGLMFLSGLPSKQFSRALRISGMSVDNNSQKEVKKIYASAVVQEFQQQQKDINKAHMMKKNIRVGIDTSFSQGLNAQYSQTAMLEAKSGEILQLAVLNKSKIGCQSNNLDALGVD